MRSNITDKKNTTKIVADHRFVSIKDKDQRAKIAADHRFVSIKG
jgi:hypothetical protein